MYDVTIQNQLPTVPTGIACLQRPQAYPYLTSEGDVYSLINFQECAQYRGHSMLDWEPNALEHIEGPGTVGVVPNAGGAIVTITGGTFPDFDGHINYPHRFYVNGNMYFVANREDPTHLKLQNTSLSVAPGASFKYARWLYRETDPQYAAPGEWQAAHDEWAVPMAQVLSMAQANSARIGIYDFLVHTYRRPYDILYNYATWQSQVAEVVNYVTSSGFSIADYIRRLGGKVWWTAYVPSDYLTNETGRQNWLLRNRRIMETCRALKLPNAPIFRRQVIGASEGVYVPTSYILDCIRSAEAYQPGEWGFWGVPGEFDQAFIDELSNYTRSLPSASLNTGPLFTLGVIQ